MDILLYILGASAVGLWRVVMNNGFTSRDKTNDISIGVTGNDSVDLTEIPVGNNLGLKYNEDCFNKIIDQFHLR